MPIRDAIPCCSTGMMYVGQWVRLWNGLPHFFRKGAALLRPCEGFAYRLQVVNLAPRLNHKEVYEANNQAYYRDRADQCRNHGSYLPSNYFSAETDRVVIEVHQAVLLTCFTRPPAAREILRWVIRYAREQAYCHFSPALIANLERHWKAKERKI